MVNVDDHYKSRVKGRPQFLALRMSALEKW